MGCPNNCTNEKQGQCADTTGHGDFKCVCKAGFTGPACADDTRCPDDLDEDVACNGRGYCASGSCRCTAPFFGNRCQLKQCPNDCSNHGSCNTTVGVCKCAPGFADDDCSLELACPGSCNNHGRCELSGPAINASNATGQPYNGRCVCDTGYFGERCENVQCAKEDGPACSGHGDCDFRKGVCRCDKAYTGTTCIWSAKMVA